MRLQTDGTSVSTNNPNTNIIGLCLGSNLATTIPIGRYLIPTNTAASR